MHVYKYIHTYIQGRKVFDKEATIQSHQISVAGQTGQISEGHVKNEDDLVADEKLELVLQAVLTLSREVCAYVRIYVCMYVCM